MFQSLPETNLTENPRKVSGSSGADGGEEREKMRQTGRESKRMKVGERREKGGTERQWRGEYRCTQEGRRARKSKTQKNIAIAKTRMQDKNRHFLGCMHVYNNITADVHVCRFDPKSRTAPPTYKQRILELI